MADRRRAQEDLTIRCPSCRKWVRERTRDYPFCSSRCRNTDLGKWFSEDYRISREVHPSGFEDEVYGEE